MPLQQGEVQGYNFDRMVVAFTMLNQGKVIFRAISTAAMDDLEGRRDVKPEERVAQFMRLREAIEERASRKFFEEQAQADRPVVLRSNDFQDRRCDRSHHSHSVTSSARASRSRILHGDGSDIGHGVAHGFWEEARDLAGGLRRMMPLLLGALLSGGGPVVVPAASEDAESVMTRPRIIELNQYGIVKQTT